MTDSAAPTTSTAPAQQPATPTPAAAPFPWFAYVLLAIVCASVVACGVALLLMRDAADPGTVTSIRITAKGDVDMQKFEEVLDTPDYYLELLTDQGSIRTKAFKDTRLGNGLTYKLPVPVPMSAVRELRVHDEDTIGKDKMMDRVDKPQREVKGEKFHFSLIGEIPPRPSHWKVGLALSICGGAILLLTILKFIRAQVV